MGDSEMDDETGVAGGSSTSTPAVSTPTPGTPVPLRTTPTPSSFPQQDQQFQQPHQPPQSRQPPHPSQHQYSSQHQYPSQHQYQNSQPPFAQGPSAWGGSYPAYGTQAPWMYPPPNWQYAPWAAQTNGPPTPNPSYGLNASRRNSTSTNASVKTVRSEASGTTTKESRTKRKRTEEGSGKGKEREIQTLHPAYPSHAPDISPLEQIRKQFMDIQQQLDRISKGVHDNPHAPIKAENDASATSLPVDSFMKQLLEGVKETHDLIRASNIFQDKPVKKSLKRKREDRPGVDADVNDGDDERERDNKSDLDEAEDDDEDDDATGMDVDQSRADSFSRQVVKTKPAHRERGANQVANEVRRIFNSKFKGHQTSPELTTNPDVENMVLDLLKKPGSIWNKTMKTLFVNAVLAMKVPIIVERRTTRSRLEDLFLSNFRRHRERMQWSQLNEQQKEAKRRAHRRHERKRTLYYRRIEAANHYDETRRHVPMVSAYGIDGMSTDESDHENGTGVPMYSIIPKTWRHPGAPGCLHTLDALHRDSRFRPIRRAGPGAHPRNRLHPPSTTPSSSPPVTGLPSGLYNPEWLASQTPLTLQDLSAFPSKEYDWSHAAAIVDLVSHNHGKLDSVFGYA